MSADEWNEWRAFWRIEPWGDVRGDWHNAILAHLIYSAHAGKRSKKLKAHDFLLSPVERPNAAQSPDQMAEAGRMLAAQLGGVWKENGKAIQLKRER